MANFSDVLDAKVISKADCSVCGIVRDAYFDEKCKNIAYFILDSDGAERLLPIEEVVSFSDALMIADNLALISPYDIDRTAYMKQPVGKEVFTRGGKLKGCVRDVVFSAKGKVNSLLVDDTVCSPGRFESFGDVILLAGDTPARKRRKLFPCPTPSRTNRFRCLSTTPKPPQSHLPERRTRPPLRKFGKPPPSSPCRQIPSTSPLRPTHARRNRSTSLRHNPRTPCPYSSATQWQK